MAPLFFLLVIVVMIFIGRISKPLLLFLSAIAFIGRGGWQLFGYPGITLTIGVVLLACFVKVEEI